MSTDLTNLLSSGVGTALLGANSAIGTNNAAQDIDTAYNNAASTQQGTQGTVTNLLGGLNAAGATGVSGLTTQAGALAPGVAGLTSQGATGTSATNQLATYLGLNGQTANPQAYLNTPGYQFAVQQGTTAAESLAAANGSAYTPNTLAAVGNYVQGAASTNYNNYINNLLSAAGIGTNANSALTSTGSAANNALGQLGSTGTQLGVSSNLETGSNISSLQAAQGSANASGTAGTSSAISSLLGSLLSGGTSAGGANTSGLTSLLSGLLGTGTPGSMSATNLSNLLGGSSSSNPYGLTNSTGTDPQATMSNADLNSQLGIDSGSGSSDLLSSLSSTTPTFDLTSSGA